jgi:hypothetical protein
MHQRDPVTGDVVVDLRSTEVYLKVLTQITSTYKMDANKLMFGNQQQQQQNQQQQNQGSNGRPD